MQRTPMRGGIALASILVLCLQACGGGSDSSGAAAVPPPEITAQPQSASSVTDGTVTFNVTASGSGLSYQWHRNGSPIAGATTASFTIPAATHADHQAQYTVVVSNAGGNVTSDAATLNLVASANQQAFESVILAGNGGSHDPSWNINLSGPQISGVNYGYTSRLALANSPATHGPQTANQGGRDNLTTTLALPAASDSRVLVGGRILAVANDGEAKRVSYVGDNVLVETLASDGVSVAYAEVRSNYRRVDLAGTMADTPAEFARWFNSWFANPAVLNAAAPWQAGAAYLAYTATNKGDRYRAFDCTTATRGTAITPCRTGMTLSAALAAGITSNSDGVTYTSADGTTASVAGVPVWVATAKRPRSATLFPADEYRIYFEMNGNVYTGSLIRDNEVIGGSYYVSNPAGAAVLDRITFLNYRVRLNQAARDSMVAASGI